MLWCSHLAMTKYGPGVKSSQLQPNLSSGRTHLGCLAHLKTPREGNILAVTSSQLSHKLIKKWTHQVC